MSGISAADLPEGFRASGVACGIKPSGRRDVAMLVGDGPCSAAGVYTTNRMCAAPVIWSRARTPSETVRAIAINSGNANAATGEPGLTDAARTAHIVAQLLNVQPDQVLLASTGIIGVALPMDDLAVGMAQAAEMLGRGVEGWTDAAEAILTTDTVIKLAKAKVELGGGRSAKILGLAKGAAMIAPNMATMLGFVLTDARVPSGSLQRLLKSAVKLSFHRISVDGHMSTNDTVLALASGQSGEISRDGEPAFLEALTDVCRQLAMQIPADGEGAQHFVEVSVSGAGSDIEAEAMARAIAESPLVKTAIAGNDPNWGRIVSAAGAVANLEVTRFDSAKLTINDTVIYDRQVPVAFDRGTLSQSMRHAKPVAIHLDFKEGTGRATIWTCDLTADYVRLNAEYTT